jgi:hypothetical protein
MQYKINIMNNISITTLINGTSSIASYALLSKLSLGSLTLLSNSFVITLLKIVLSAKYKVRAVTIVIKNIKMYICLV